jgi:hypothetical protein
MAVWGKDEPGKMTTEERFERIEQDLHTASGLLVGVTDRLDGVSVRLEGVSARLDRAAVRLSVREARKERSKRRELDERVTQLTAAVQTFIDSLRRGGNEHT